MSQVSRLRLILPVIGLLQGLGMYLTGELMPSLSFSQAWVMVAIVLVGLAWQLAWGAKSLLKLLLGGLVVGVLVALPIANQQAGDALFNPGIISLNFVELTLAGYIIACFFWVYCLEDGWRFPYPQLFRIAWDHFLIILTALLFTLLCWAVLELWRTMFDSLGFRIFGDIFHSTPFRYIATMSFIGLGLAIGRQYQNVISRLRQIIMAMFFLLLVPVAIIGLTYWLLSLFRMQQASDSWGFIFAVAVISIILLNGVVQDGQTEVRYYRWIKWLLNILFLVMPFAVGICLSFPLKPMLAYGLDSFNLFMLIFVAIIFCYSLCYGLAVFFSQKRWMHFITRVNPYLAILLAIVLIAINTPVLDLNKISVANQVARLKENKPIKDLRGADLSGLNLSGRDLSKINLTGANLSNTNLQGTVLSGANLSAVNLSNANLSKANLQKTYIYGANLSGTNLSNTNLKVTFGLNQTQLGKACGVDVKLPAKLHIKACEHLPSNE